MRIIVADIRGGVTAFEELIQSGSTGEPSPADVGLATETPRCAIEVEGAASDDGGQKITCTLKGNPKVAGKTIELTRNSSGLWSCTVDADLDAKYKPQGCN